MDRDNGQFEEAAPNKKLFIAGLDWNATDDDLREAFAPFGEVVQAAVVRYADTGRSKGFGFVEYNTVEEATAALEKMNGATILNRAVRVSYAFPKRDRDDRQAE